MGILKCLIISLYMTLVFICCERNYSLIDTSLNEIMLNTNPFEYNYTEQDSAEAKEFALWLSREFQPPDSLVSKLLYSLNYLRHKYGVSFSFLDISKGGRRFLAPWVISQLIITFDDTTKIKVINNQYSGWDSLEKFLQPNEILHYPDKLGVALLGFDDFLHPERLAEIYIGLPGIIWCEPNFLMFAGWAYYPILPGLDEDGLTYLFGNEIKNGRNYSYFKYQQGEPQYIGMWIQGNKPEPFWWAEAKSNKENFIIYDGP